MRLIDADALTEKCGDWYVEEGTEEGFIGTLGQLLSVQPDTTTHDSIPAETGKNDGDGTSGDCISRQVAIDALRGYLVEKRCPDDGTLTCRLIENEVINKLPSIQPERKKGTWTKDASCPFCGFKPWYEREIYIHYHFAQTAVRRWINENRTD